METAVIKVTRYRSPNGQPTCCANVETGEVCRFFGVRRMGTEDVCMLGEQRDLWRIGYGYTIPHDKCEVWSAENSEDKLRSALAGLLEFPGGQYSECDGWEEAWAEAKAALMPNVGGWRLYSVRYSALLGGW